MNISRNPHASREPRANRAPRRSSGWAPVLACLATVLGLPVHAAVSLPDIPMQTNNGVPPNIWFILDDSGSMTWRYMYNGQISRLTVNGNTVSSPTGDNTTRDSTYGSGNSTALVAMYDQAYTTNQIYYNPAVTYRGWQNADGSYMANTPYNAAYNDNNNASGAGDLGGAVRVFYVPLSATSNWADATQYAKYSFLMDGSARRCVWTSSASDFTTCSTPTSFTWGAVTRTLAQEKQNFANWHSYHRTRIKVAKAGASYAFNDTGIFNADNQYRVGFTTIWQRNEFRIPVGSNNGLFVGNNSGENRRTWFDRLFAATGNNGTPLQAALNRAGQYYSESGNTGPYGPQASASQYECRQNFTILTTDGYWNSGTVASGNVDNTSGSSIPRPLGDPNPAYQYTPAAPYMDSWTSTLADVAMNYWNRDLRTDLENKVPASAANPAYWQHMVTFGISIGLRGSLDPKNDMTGLKNGTIAWPDPTDSEDIQRIDDLFHAAVNGRGAFVAASNPDEFVDGLGTALRAIAERKGSGSNASVASASATADTKFFRARYFTSKWYGELTAFPVTGGTIGSTPLWNASIPAPASRTILTYSGSPSSPGATFPTAAQTTALTTDVTNYLRGDRSKEESAGPLRARTSLLGDIVNSSPVYVKTSSTVETVFVGANDGMLHAFNATTGVERFAYVPGGLDLTELKEVSQPDYGHRFFVDGAITVSGKSLISNRQILVGALGRGGKGLFALDVTDPTSFSTSKVLWDKNGSGETNMGLILGRPLMAKLNNGSTAVIVPNGLNSSSERAVLYVFDLVTGAKIAEIDTGVGSSTATNGLSSPRGWDFDRNGTVDYVYAGDFRGNLWKFDLSNANTSQWRVANNRPMYAPTNGLSQPITGGVSIGVDPRTDKRWVFFGTGRLLTSSDITDTSLQSWYGVIDDDAATSSATRATLTARQITAVSSGVRTFEANANLSPTSRGWYVDLDLPSGTLEGERMVGDMQVVNRTLVSPSIIPDTSNPCRPGRGYVNAIDAYTGTSTPSPFFDINNDGSYGGAGDSLGGNAVGSRDLGIGMGTNFALPQGIQCGSAGECAQSRPPRDFIGGRISWREVLRN